MAAQYNCSGCGKKLGGWFHMEPFKCINPVCGKIWCPACAKGVVNKSCPTCGNVLKKIK